MKMQVVTEMKKEIDRSIKILPSDKAQELIDFAKYLRWQEEKRTAEIVEYDEWAINLAREKGFDYLTKKDTIRIIKECRRG